MIRIIAGIVIGIIMARNGQAMAAPVASAVILGAVLGFLLCYFYGRRDKNTAVATAVAVAVAKANSAADARANAVANQAVQIFMARADGDLPRAIPVMRDADPVLMSAYRDALDASPERVLQMVTSETDRSRVSNTTSQGEHNGQTQHDDSDLEHRRGLARRFARRE